MDPRKKLLTMANFFMMIPTGRNSSSNEPNKDPNALAFVNKENQQQRRESNRREPLFRWL